MRYSQHPQLNIILKHIQNSCLEIFGEALTGIYIHGSLAFGCFRWEKSDIDFLVAVKTEPELSKKVHFLKKLLELDESCPPKGLEVSVVLEQHCKNFIYPTPFVLHFSNMHKERCKKNPQIYCQEMQGTDKDLAAHFMVTKTTGITLFGKEISETFGPVPKEAYLDSIKGDMEHISTDISKDPVYMILNACRILAFIKEEQILSKEQGGRWGLEHLPQEYLPLIKAALLDYAGETSFAEKNLQKFSAYVSSQIP